MQGRYKSKRAEVLALILQGSSPKAAAIQAGAHGCYGNKVTAWHGLEPLYVSEAEKGLILNNRAAWREHEAEREAVLTGRSRLTQRKAVRPSEASNRQ